MMWKGFALSAAFAAGLVIAGWIRSRQMRVGSSPGEPAATILAQLGIPQSAPPPIGLPIAGIGKDDIQDTFEQARGSKT
jgi:hypothetical protein